MSKILCPYHEDTNPSMHVYEKYAHCFVCGARMAITKSGDIKDRALVREDIAKSLLNILLLPKTTIRGLELYSDRDGYYLLWPRGNYYKKRLWKGKSRYIGPKGHTPPLMSFDIPYQDRLVIVEGELNAMSLNLCGIKAVICSPGSATNLMRYIKDYLRYSEVCVIVDYDEPGVANGALLRDELLKHGKRVQLIAMEDRDLNDILQEEGKEGVRKWADSRVEMLKRMQNNIQTMPASRSITP